MQMRRHFLFKRDARIVAALFVKASVEIYAGRGGGIRPLRALRAA